MLRLPLHANESSRETFPLISRNSPTPFLPITAQLLSKAAHAYSGDATFRTDAIVTLGLSSTMVRWNTARARDEILCTGATTADGHRITGLNVDCLDCRQAPALAAHIAKQR